MSATVFVSHASADRGLADDIRAQLEERGVACWIASRDIAPGGNFGEEITRAMCLARVMVLVFSRNADRSDEIKKEVVLAGQQGVTVIPLRVENVMPSGAMQYELVTRQWIDFYADREAGMDRLVRQIEQVAATPRPILAKPPALPEPQAATPTPSPPPPPPAAAPPQAERHNLPIEVSAFIGRDTEVADISRFLTERRRLTLVGSGGVGKTRVATQVGMALLDQFRDGVWLVELAPLADAALVAEAACRVISAPVTGARSAVEVAIAFLRQKNLLLILDNCEHLLAAAAELKSALLSHCPEVSVLATSRQPLRIPGEVVYKLPSLPVPKLTEGLTAACALRFASVQLMVQRASDAGGGYTLSDADAPFVSKICRRLDGVAMAIELAAARMRVLKPAEIASRLENAFRLLNSGGNSALSRHQTLWATIDWSHSLLAPMEQVLLRRLSVFVDGFSLEGATQAAQGDEIDPDDVLDLLELLVDKSLVTVDMSGHSARFRMLEATRHYAREKLKASGETGRDHLAACYLAEFYQSAELAWSNTPTDAWLAEFGAEAENLRAAIDWAFGESAKYHVIAGETGDPALGIELVANAGSLAEELSLQADMKRWTTTALTHLTPETPPGHAGWVYLFSTRWDWEFGASAISAPRQQAIKLFRAAKCPRGLSKALRIAAMAISRPGDMPQEVRPMLTEAIDILRPQSRSKGLATALAQMGAHHYFMGDYAASRQYFNEAQTMRKSLGDRSGLLASSLSLAELDFISGQRDKAIADVRAAIADARAAANMALLANLLANLAGYLLTVGEVAEGREAALESLSLNRALGLEGFAIFCLEHLALALALSGAHSRAAQLLGYTEGHIRRTQQGRDLLEQAGYDRLLAILTENLPPASLAAHLALGETWEDDHADHMAREDASQMLEEVAA